MSKVNQKTAVVNTILALLEDRGVDYVMGGEVIMNDILEPTDKEKIKSVLFTMFRANEVEYKESFQAKVDDDSELKKYISGLLNNWVRKNKDFNAGQVYKAKNPGSRAGSTDPSIKAMRQLLSVTPDENAKLAIQTAIDAKLAEIKASKQTVTINIDAIPEELKHLLPSVTTEEA